MQAIERFKQVMQSPKSLEKRQLSEQEIMQISEDARIVKGIGTKIAIISIPILAGNAIVSYGMNNPPADVDWNAYTHAVYANTVVMGIGAGALCLGLYMREKAKDASKFVRNHSPKQ